MADNSTATAAMLDVEHLERFRSIGVERRFAPGERLVSLGSSSSEVFYLLEGLVKIVVLSAAGTESVFGLRAPGSFVGEMSTLNNARRSADVVAVESTTTVMVTAKRFIEFLESNPRVALKLLQMQSRRLNEMTLRTMLGGRSVRARLAQRLIELSGGTAGAVVSLTHGDLAQFIDASREWTTKALGELRRLGAIRTERGRVVIVDENALISASLDE